tara:strand:+ start:337 stop:585 length:249 start_codon:yes stop_codon:yes gene_type:complete
MKKYFLFSAGVSLLFGLIVGNLCSETKYYAPPDTPLSEHLYEVRNSDYDYSKVSFNYSFGVQASIGVFALSMIGYSFIRKIK